jgi:hypothetical protein
MSSGGKVLLALLLASAVVVFTVGLIAAFGTPPWQEDGVPVCVVNGGQEYPHIAPDGSGGAIVTWGDGRDYGDTNYDVYVQRLDADGNTMWLDEAVSLCVASEGQYSRRIVSDGSGGAIVTWQDRRQGSGNDDIYARRVYSDGTAAWATDGVSLCVAADYQARPQIASDGLGGAIVTWQDERDDATTADDIYARRVDSGGNALWITGGVSICVSTNNQGRPQIASDGSGGAIVTWHDFRSGTSDDIYAQRVDAGGNTLWADNGVSLCVASGDQVYPQIATDGSGGAIVIWQDYRDSGATGADIYAQRVYSDGTTAWAVDGVSLSIASNYQYYPRIASDGLGGAVVAWEDHRWSTDGDIYAQRVDGDGNILWQADGVTICTAIDEQIAPQVASDGARGAFITWQDGRNGSDFDIYARRVYSDGSVAWPPDGLGLCLAEGDQLSPRITWNGNSAAIVTWEDRRAGVGPRDIYAQPVGDYHTAVRLPMVAKNH